MDGTPLWLGIYAAGVATAAIFVELVLWRRSRQTRLRVTLEPYVDPDGEFASLVAFVINFSEFPVKAQIELRGDQDSWALIEHARVIEPRDHFFAIVAKEALRDLYHFWGGEKVRASAHLPTKQSFHSKWVDLDEWTAPEWNRLPRD